MNPSKLCELCNGMGVGKIVAEKGSKYAYEAHICVHCEGVGAVSMPSMCEKIDDAVFPKILARTVNEWVSEFCDDGDTLIVHKTTKNNDGDFVFLQNKRSNMFSMLLEVPKKETE